MSPAPGNRRAPDSCAQREGLAALGWRPFFAQQVRSSEAALRPARIVAVHRTGHILCDGLREQQVRLGRYWFRLPPEQRPTVGDWVLLDARARRIERCLARSSVLQRTAAGARADGQLIGANVDAACIATSCNAEFSAARLQRYLALAAAAGIAARIVLTKADLADEPQTFAQRAAAVAGGAPIETVNALDAESLGGLRAILRAGDTIALLGSSGVGKSTLLNTLCGHAVQSTAPIRERDARGRHTTTARSLNRLPGGALILDGPGVREVAMAAADDPADAYADIEALARNCRFADCMHETEPGCAVRAALADGLLAAARFEAYRQLARERGRHPRRAHPGGRRHH